MELYNIKDFAAKAGVSKQSIYERIRKDDSPLKDYVIKRQGKIYLRAEALSFYNSDVEEEKPKEEEKTAPPQDDIITLLKEQIEYLKAQIAQKDEEIKNLTLTLLNQTTMISQIKQLPIVEEESGAQDIPAAERKKRKLWPFGRISDD